ncbi:hypothetical protein D3C84_365180 [compost metagenome]
MAIQQWGAPSAAQQQPFQPRRVIAAARLLLIGTLASTTGGCSALQRDSFTLEVDLPAHFKFSGDAYYRPAPGESCSLERPGRQFFKTDYVDRPHRVSFQVPLYRRDGRCRLALSSIVTDYRAKWGERWGDDSGDFGALSFRDQLAAGRGTVPASGVKQFNGRCQWLFRTVGPARDLIKILQCKAADEQGQAQQGRPGGAVRRDQVAGKTVRLVLGMAGEEKPYYRDYWFRTPNGWKPCGGRWGRDMEELCLDPPQFKTFKLPDGRQCTVYPNCTE